MEEKITAKVQEGQDPSEQQDGIVQNINDMITDLLKDVIDDMQKAEKGASDEGDKESSAAQVGITDLKNIVGTIQKVLDNTNMMIAHVEGGTYDDRDKDVFLDDYMATADSILEMAVFSTKDNITGLSNRHGFDSRLVLEWNRATRDSSPLSLLLFSIDEFKEHEKECGHKQWDGVLQTIAKTLDGSIKRTTDFVARWSDEEFAALLPLTDADGAMIVAQRIHNEVENMSIPLIDGKGGKITACIGVCVKEPGQTEQPAGFTEKAINALNTARDSGSNRIVFA